MALFLLYKIKLITIIFLLIIFQAFSLPTFNSTTPNILCPESERQALLTFKQDLIGQTNKLSSWDVEEDCCKWLGVFCNNETGHVQQLLLGGPDENDFISEEDFSQSQLKGKINPSLLDLKHLTHLNLSYNSFRFSPIPSFIGSIVSLRYLNLDSCEFEGLIPYQLGNLSNLAYLSVRVNNLHVKNLHWLSGLSSLEYLDMSFVNLTEANDHWLLSINTLTSLLELRLSDCELFSLPPLRHVNFTSLEVLDISRNSFSSSFSSSFSPPNWLFRLSNLVSIYLDYTNLGFNSPSTLCGLKNLTLLETIDLSENSFNTIPACLYGFSNLKHLTLTENNFRGVLSSSIKNLTSLITLDLSNNGFEGKIPQSMGSLCSLESVNLGYNKFDGNISEAIVSLSGCNPNRLKSLDLSSNFFSGQLTSQIGEFKHLTYLDLSENKLSGPIPESIGKLSALQNLVIRGNEFNGSLPESLGSLSSLDGLDISNNRFKGVVSESHFTNLKKLTYLEASQNSMTLSVSQDWIPPFQLSYIGLGSWKLGPRFPMWIKTQKEAWSVDISNAGISDHMPSWIWNFSTNIGHLNLSHNQIHGQIHSVNYSSTIYLGSNNFDGPLPRIASGVYELDLSNNSFSGDISSFLCNPIGKENVLTFLHLGKNHLSGKIPDCWTYWPRLEFINLVDDNLIGEIPSSIGSLVDLGSLHLRNNSLSGEIPMSLRKCTQLKIIDLDLNKFEGRIPAWIGTSLSMLRILGLRANQFGGKIPFELCGLSNLQILDAAQNNLSGVIPRCFNNLTAMATRPIDGRKPIGREYITDNAFVVTRGREDEYDAILKLVVSLDLSENNLSGDFPEQLTSLRELFSLNLSGNHLRGTIPSTISQLTSAQSLDFSRNKLSGKIPQSVAGMSFITIFNVSHNNLSGEIPRSTQLQGMETSNLVGNPFLCGPPLANACKETRPSTDHNETEDSEKDEEEYWSWFRLGIGVGFGVGFLGVISPLLIYPPWRRFYFWALECIWYKIYDFFIYRI